MSRYINADALMEEYNLDKATKYGNETREEQSFSYSTMMMYEIADMIDNAPTADVRPNVRGEWVDFPTKNVPRNAILYRCSICGMQKFFETEQTMNVYITTMSEYKFCPNCGADMRKKGEE